jgi:hypothetical protein
MASRRHHVSVARSGHLSGPTTHQARVGFGLSGIIPSGLVGGLGSFLQPQLALETGTLFARLPCVGAAWIASCITAPLLAGAVAGGAYVAHNAAAPSDWALPYLAAWQAFDGWMCAVARSWVGVAKPGAVVVTQDEEGNAFVLVVIPHLHPPLLQGVAHLAGEAVAIEAQA